MEILKIYLKTAIRWAWIRQRDPMRQNREKIRSVALEFRRSFTGRGRLEIRARRATAEDNGGWRIGSHGILFILFWTFLMFRGSWFCDFSGLWVFRSITIPGIFSAVPLECRIRVYANTVKISYNNLISLVVRILTVVSFKKHFLRVK